MEPTKIKLNFGAPAPPKDIEPARPVVIKERLEKPLEIKRAPKITTPDKAEQPDINIEKRYKALQLKKILMTSIIGIVLLALIIFGTYNTFLKKSKSSQQIATETNTLNNTTPFPTEGVYGYLSMNLNTLLKPSIQFDQGTTDFKVNQGDFYITDIAKKDAYIANIYFTARITTTTGSNLHNFVLPLKYDWVHSSYSPAGVVVLSPVQKPQNTVPVTNDMLSFANMTPASKENITSSQDFVSNFLLLVYNENVDLKGFYTGTASLKEPTAKFVEVKSFEMYTTDNLNGYNTLCTYTLKLDEGIEFTTTTYLKIVKNGSSWKITMLL